uniref:RIKEN cDNA A430005L14 gene n=1 Tax=Mus musculus TaxID=10090 RepID=D6RH81_MOUSE
MRSRKVECGPQHAFGPGVTLQPAWPLPGTLPAPHLLKQHVWLPHHTKLRTDELPKSSSMTKVTL